MNWVAYIQHRKQFLVTGVVLALILAFMIPTGLNFWHTYQHALVTCKSTGTCSQLPSTLFQSYTDSLLLHLVPAGVILSSVVLGIFWGVPLLSREYSEGTNKFAWTQGVSRKRWLTLHLMWLLAGTAIVAAILTIINSWWFKAYNDTYLSRFNAIDFSSQGIVLIGYSIFAVSLGVCLGALFKRTMAAIGTTLVLLIALVVIIVPNFIRPYYMTPFLYKAAINNQSINSSPVNNGATLLVSQTIVSPSGQAIDWNNPPSKCVVAALPTPPAKSNSAVAPAANIDQAVIARNGGPPVYLKCLGSLGYKWNTKYQPANRYWDFQGIETALYLVGSLIPIGATYWLVLKRDA